MNLRSRFLLLSTALILLATAVSWGMFRVIAENVIEEWGLRVMDSQVRYDSARLLQPIEREIALARQMAESQVLKRWAQSPLQTNLYQQAVRELESYRQNFYDKSYFLALTYNGAYYHNNAQNTFADQPLRYHLQQDKPADAWFFQLLAQNRTFHINVNPDEALGVTKLWIDVLMRDDQGKPLAVVGTGMDLGAFLNEVVDLNQPGINSMFVDGNGAVQLHRDAARIDYATLVKPEGQKSLFTQMLDHPEDRERLRAHMKTLADASQGVDKSSPTPTAQTAQVISDFADINGKRHLIGMAFLPSIGWYELTTIDLDQVMPVARFMPMAGALGVIVLASLLLFHFSLQSWVLGPLAALQRAMERVRKGDLQPTQLPQAQGEVRQLIEHFSSMAEAIRHHTEELETKVRERTEALDRLARNDPLTGLLNRRGMSDVLEQVSERVHREGLQFGLLYLDVDWFKDINDQHGHAAGDSALVQVAHMLRSCLRPYDYAGRWGGDEFIVLLAPCDVDTLAKIGERIRADVERQTHLSGHDITVSIGGTMVHGRHDVDGVLHRADRALYAAKEKGRNVFHLANESTP